MKIKGPLTWELESAMATQIKNSGGGKNMEELQKLREGVKRLIRLMELSELQVHSSSTAMLWMEEARKLSYDIEDYFAYEAEISGARADAAACIGCLVKIYFPYNKLKRRSLIQTNTKELATRVQAACTKHQSDGTGSELASEPRLSEERPDGRRPPDNHHGGLVTHLRAMEQDVRRLLATGAREQLNVVSILGPGGVGKTTLAKWMYQNNREKFSRHAFVRVSLYPDTRRLLTSIFSQIDKKQGPPVLWDANELIDNIAECLREERFLIIIDDLWNASLWDIISHAFPKGSSGSQIVTTTQIEDVALACCGYRSDYIFKMKPLKEMQLRELFFSKAFGSEDDCPNDYKQVSYKIISLCGGLPLSTVNIASLLARKPVLPLNDWERIERSLCSNSWPDPSNLPKQATEVPSKSSEGINKVLNVVYNNLPPHLKSCLLYLNMYPADYTIKKYDLVKQWVAEGFLSAVGEDVEKCAVSYFDELVYRGMIQPKYCNGYGQVLSCTVPHTVLDFIAYKSMEENFITIVDYFQTGLRLPDKVRRLSIQFGGAKSANVPAGIRVSHVRTLMFFGFFKCIPSIVKYRLLRVLVLHVWADQDKVSFDLARISELFLLRYLKVNCNVTVKLPKLMDGLRFMETLDLNARLYAVPLDIVQLQSLLHLGLPGASSKRLPSLPSNHETLEFFPRNCVFSYFPTWIGQVSKLRILEISVRELRQDDINVLNGLNALTAVSLYSRTALQPIVINKDEFKNLEHFKFISTALYLSFKEGAMPNVLGLKLGFRANTKPEHRIEEAGLENLKGLEVLFIKIGGTADDNGFDRKDVQDKLENAFIKSRGSCPSINVYLVDGEKEGPESRPPLSEPQAQPPMSVYSISASEDVSSGDRPTSHGLTRETITSPHSTESSSNVWILDSGASCHITSDSTLLHDLQLEEKPYLQVLMNGAAAPIHGCGSVKTKRLNIPHIFYVPGLTPGRNIISMPKLCRDHGLAMVSAPPHCVLRDSATGREVGRARATNGGMHMLDYLLIGQDVDESLLATLSQESSQAEAAEQSSCKGGSGKEEATMLATGREAPSAASSGLKKFSMSEVRQATVNFSQKNRIGACAFSDDYKGVLRDGQVVAIKKFRDMLHIHHSNLQQMEFIWKVEHQNILKCLGCAYKNVQTVMEAKQIFCLVQEYIPNGYFETINRGTRANWSSRLQLIQGIARGIHFLHEQNFMHLSLNPANILVDEDDSGKNAKIKDVGISRMFDESPRAIGRQPMDEDYMAPEYIMHDEVSPKVDVFAFGVILIETIRGMCKSYPRGGRDSVQWATEVRDTGRQLKELFDPSLFDESQLDDIKTCMEVGLQCAERDPERRPTMREVVQRLGIVNIDKTMSATGSEAPSAPSSGPKTSTKGLDGRFSDDDKDCIFAAQQMGSGVFGTPISVEKLKATGEYKEPITQTDVADYAMKMINAGGKEFDAQQFVDNLKDRYAHGISVKCLIYNATGTTLTLATKKDWQGHIYGAPYPSVIQNGQWGAFLHVHPSWSGSSAGAVVYRSKVPSSSESCDWLFSWSIPRIGDNRVYTKIREKGNYLVHYWDHIYREELENSGRSSTDNGYGYVSETDIGQGPTVDARAIFQLPYTGNMD